jgi:uncharacterized protein
MEEQTVEVKAEQGLDGRRIALFCVLAFVISGSAALYIALNGGLDRLPKVQTVLILALWYMPGPALAHLLTRLITREGWHGLWLRPYFRQAWPQWLIVWFLPGLLIIAGGGLYFAFFPQYFDPALGPLQAIADQAAAAGTPLPFGVQMLLLVQVVQGLLLSPVLNAIFTLGEEFGWRAYLLPKLMVLGWRRASLLTGVIWGLWHWPILAMGYNYGLAYAGAPWLGMLLFVWFTTIFGVMIGWLTLRGKSVWPAVIGHGALNGIAALPGFFIQGSPNPLLGPLPMGLIASIPMALVAFWCWWNPPPTRR